MKKNKRFNFKWLLKEILVPIIPVMFGVYIGLLANNWNESKQDKARTIRSMESLAKEISYNQNMIAESLKYFTELRDSIYDIDDRQTKVPSSFTFWKGLNPPLLKHAAFDATSLNGTLNNLDLELLEQLSTCYNLQEDLKAQSDSYIFSITNKIGTSEFNNENYLIILENYCHDQIGAETQLLEALKNAGSQLSEKLDNP